MAVLGQAETLQLWAVRQHLPEVGKGARSSGNVPEGLERLHGVLDLQPARGSSEPEYGGSGMYFFGGLSEHNGKWR